MYSDTPSKHVEGTKDEGRRTNASAIGICSSSLVRQSRNNPAWLLALCSKMRVSGHYKRDCFAHRRAGKLAACRCDRHTAFDPHRAGDPALDKLPLEAQHTRPIRAT